VCEISSLILRVFENRLLRRILGASRKEVQEVEETA
jgi:hypothetical protein